MEIMEIGENQLDGIVDQSERYIKYQQDNLYVQLWLCLDNGLF